MDRIRAQYELHCPPTAAAPLAEAVAHELTVEIPPALVPGGFVREQVLARTESLGIEALGEARHALELSFSAPLANRQIPQLLNLLFGNASMYPGVRLVGFELPPALLDAFAGPRFGIAGVRELCCATPGKALLASALKPRGIPLEQHEANAEAFAAGGGDILKDDQNLVDDSQAEFAHRIDRIATAVERGRERAGRGTQYFPHVAAPFEELRHRLEAVVDRGLRGVLLSPHVLGVDTARGLAAEFDLAFMAHPSFSGSYTVRHEAGLAPWVLWGQLWRLAGCDLSVFPNRGGRFDLSDEDTARVADALRRPWGALRPALPTPAGGMGFDNIPRMVGRYGPDTALLIGGALLGHGPDLGASTREFRAAIDAA